MNDAYRLFINKNGKIKLTIKTKKWYQQDSKYIYGEE